MEAIAWRTTGSWRAVMETRAPGSGRRRWRRGVERGIGPSDHRAGPPHAWLSSARHRPAGPPSQAEFVEPFRSLLATITGADSGVVTVASSAFKPSTRCGPTRRPACYSRRSVPSGTRMTTPWRKPSAGSTTELINPNKPWRTAEDLEVATLHYLD